VGSCWNTLTANVKVIAIKTTANTKAIKLRMTFNPSQQAVAEANPPSAGVQVVNIDANTVMIGMYKIVMNNVQITRKYRTTP
jgi:hypothetical protein